ncbi:MAG: DNA phosphorothioation-dependent restriction protein DptF [Lachnotalea sp.]
MGVCDFVDELNRLRKSSSDSIDNVMKFDDFKKYIHIQRTAEEDLKILLREMKAVNHKKMILLCGSAGDGKSHLLSYLKNADEERLLDNYIIYNDATESNAPTKTAIQTLNELLDGFADDNLNKPGESIILAINLGVLSNFIESPEIGNRFKELNKYVGKNEILSSKISENNIDKESIFQHISFADYHMYTLTENGIKTDYIEEIFDRIFSDSEDNIFYQAYMRKISECPLAKKCPVKNNYEYLQEETNRKYVSHLLIQAIIKNKVVLTTREILNYVYDILVSSDFSFSRLYATMTNQSNFLKEYLKNITPTLMFDNGDVSALMNTLREYDPLLIRNEKSDEMAITYNVSNNVKKMIVSELDGTPYLNVIGEESAIDIIEQSKNGLKSTLFSIMVRTKWGDLYEKYEDEYSSYLKDIYYFNTGKIPKLSSLYSKVENAVLGWCGMGEDKSICLDDSHLQYAIYENVKFEPSLKNIPQQNEDVELIRFVPRVIVGFKNQKDPETDITLDIDYSLYHLICQLNNGYTQTADDRNNHADFMSFVDRILKAGTADEKILIKGISNAEATLEKTSFGYKFRMVK